jgi:hypothetical protein
VPVTNHWHVMLHSQRAFETNECRNSVRRQRSTRDVSGDWVSSGLPRDDERKTGEITPVTVTMTGAAYAPRADSTL